MPVNPSVPAAPLVRRVNVDCNNFMTNDVILATDAELYDRMPSNLQSTFVRNLSRWVINKYDDTLEEGSLPQNFRKNG